MRQFDIWTRDITRRRFTWNDLIIRRVARCCNSHHVRQSSLSIKINQLLLIPVRGKWWWIKRRKGSLRLWMPKLQTLCLGRWTTGNKIVWSLIHTYQATRMRCSTLFILHFALLLLLWEEAKTGLCMAEWLLYTGNTSPCFSLDGNKQSLRCWTGWKH